MIGENFKGQQESAGESGRLFQKRIEQSKKEIKQVEGQGSKGILIGENILVFCKVCNSNIKTYFPVDALIPQLTAAPKPRLEDIRITFAFGKVFSTAAFVPSVELLSTTQSSKLAFGYREAKTCFIAVKQYFFLFQVGIITETFGSF